MLVRIAPLLNIYVSPILTSDSFAAALATRRHSITFENPQQGPIGFSLKKSVTTLLSHFIPIESKTGLHMTCLGNLLSAS